MEDVNRIKLVLVEKKCTNKRFEQIGVIPSTVSKWCTNSSQQEFKMLTQMANILNVDGKSFYTATRSSL